MNSFVLGARLALEEYFDFKENTDGYEQCLNLLLDVYEQYKDGKIKKEDLVWTIGELHRIMRG